MRNNIIVSLILDLIYPRRCAGCGRYGQYLCLKCRQTIPVQSFQPPLPNSLLDGHLALFPYTGVFRQLILNLKYGYITDISQEICQFASDTLLSCFPTIVSHWQTHHYYLVPIPLHPLRHNWRGFNQSELIGSAIASSLKIPIISNLVTRSRNTPPQARQVQRHHRLSNLKNSFTINQQLLFNIPSNIILFDDVFTTGATLQSVAHVLKNAGARSIFGLTLAG